MQVILGSGGAIARPLAEALATYTDQVRCVSRHPHVLPKGDNSTRYEHVSADLLDAEAVNRAVAGAEIVYLTAGLTYDSRVWREEWPRVAANVSSACAKTRRADGSPVRLSFFDNVYAYAKTSYPHMTEDAALDPPSVKGQTRLKVLEQLWAAHARGDLNLTVGRAADFYGPGAVQGHLNTVVFDKLIAGKTAQWLGAADLPHSFTFTPDAGKHFALLANDDRAYGQSWHLPTAADPWTPREWVRRTAESLKVPNKLQVLPRPLFWLLGRFNRPLWELYDVSEQHRVPYVFDAGKFERAFGVEATPYAEGLARCLAGVQSSD